MGLGSKTMPLLRQTSSEGSGIFATRAHIALVLWSAAMTLGNLLLLSSYLFFAAGRSAPQELSAPVLNNSTCMDSAFELRGINSSWHLMKQIPPPAKCKVKGFVIERLEPEYNFRRGWALGYVSNPEDKTHLLPYLRPFQDRAMAAKKRRVLVSLGAQKWENVLWFLNKYPLDFTEIHVLEEKKGHFKKPSSKPIGDEGLLDTMNAQSQVEGAGSLPVPDWVLNRVRIYYNFIRNTDAEVPNSPLRSVNITKVLYRNLKLSEGDAVVMLMDIENAEWDVLPVWMLDPGMPDVIDELFLSVHYEHTSMAQLQTTAGHTREEAVQLYSQLRFKGFFVHPWP